MLFFHPLLYECLVTKMLFRLPLHYACEKGNYDVAVALISQIEQMEKQQSLISRDNKGIM